MTTRGGLSSVNTAAADVPLRSRVKRVPSAVGARSADSIVVGAAGRAAAWVASTVARNAGSHHPEAKLGMPVARRMAGL